MPCQQVCLLSGSHGQYNPRAELNATQQNLLEEYECQLNKEIEENVAILSHLSQYGQVGEQVPHQEIQQALKREKKNASKLVTLQYLNEELLSIAEEQHQQLRACVLPSSTESKKEAEEQERIRPKVETTSAEVANISQQHAALLREQFSILCQAQSIPEGEPKLPVYHQRRGRQASSKIWWSNCHKYLTPQLQVVRGSGSWNLFIRHPH